MGKLARTETVTVRLDPRLNYLCELAGRAQRRTKSSFVEWAIQQAIKEMPDLGQCACSRPIGRDRPIEGECVMGPKNAIQRHRANQHRHALERLRERYLPDASHEDLIALRDLAAKQTRNMKAAPGTDTRIAFIQFQGCLIKTVYCPRHNAIRTVLPRN